MSDLNLCKIINENCHLHSILKNMHLTTDISNNYLHTFCKQADIAKKIITS